MADPAREDKPRRSGIAGIAPFLTLGIQLAISVVVFFFIGRWLDEYFNTAPWISLAGAVLGIAGGMIKFIRSAMELGKGADEEYKRVHRHEQEDD